MKNRIKQIRKDADVSQTKFGERLGVTLSAVQKWEMGLNQPDSASIKLICEKFGVSEAWLRDGVGDPYPPKSREAELGEFMKSLFKESPESFRSALLTTLLKFDPAGPEWEILERIYESVASQRNPEE